MDVSNKEVDPAEAKGGSGEVQLPEPAMSPPYHSLPAAPIRHYPFGRSWISLPSPRAAGRQDVPVLGRHAARPALLRAGVKAGQVQRVRMDEGRP
jgi:hypothetical protein